MVLVLYGEYIPSMKSRELRTKFEVGLIWGHKRTYRNRRNGKLTLSIFKKNEWTIKCSNRKGQTSNLVQFRNGKSREVGRTNPFDPCQSPLQFFFAPAFFLLLPLSHRKPLLRRDRHSHRRTGKTNRKPTMQSRGVLLCLGGCSWWWWYWCCCRMLCASHESREQVRTNFTVLSSGPAMGVALGIRRSGWGWGASGESICITCRLVFDLKAADLSQFGVHGAFQMAT